MYVYICAKWYCIVEINLLLLFLLQVWCCTISSDDEMVVSGSRDGTIRLWKSANGQLISLFNAGVDIFTVRLSSDKRTIVALGDKYAARKLVMLQIVHTKTKGGASRAPSRAASRAASRTTSPVPVHYWSGRLSCVKVIIRNVPTVGCSLTASCVFVFGAVDHYSIDNKARVAEIGWWNKRTMLIENATESWECCALTSCEEWY